MERRTLKQAAANKAPADSQQIEPSFNSLLEAESWPQEYFETTSSRVAAAESLQIVLSFNIECFGGPSDRLM